MNLQYLSCEAPGLLCLGAKRMKPRYFQRVEGRVQATPDIAFGDKKALWERLQNVEAYPDEIVVQETNGDTFMYVGL